MRIAPNLNFTGTIVANTPWLSSFVQQIKTIYQNLAQAINGNITFGDGTNTDNLNNAWINTTTPVAPNTDFTVDHNLDRIPAGYIVMEKDRAVDVYTGSVPATKTQLTLRATVASAVIRLFIITILLAIFVVPLKAQGDFYHDIALYNRTGVAGIIASPLITVCLGVQTNIPCAGPTTIFTCQAVNFTCVGLNPFNGDLNGNFGFWATASTTYTISITGVGVQGYNVVFTAPVVAGGGGTFSSVISSSANPALSGFIRMASLDQICWRNNANTADLCINKNSSDLLFFGVDQFAYINIAQGFVANQTFAVPLCLASGAFTNCFTTAPTSNRTTTIPDNSGVVAELNLAQTWTATQVFAGLQWKDSTIFAAVLHHINTASRTYTFPDITDNVVLRSSTDTLTNKTLVAPVINGTSTGTGVQGTGAKLLSSDASGVAGSPLCRDSGGSAGGATANGCGSTQEEAVTFCASGCSVTGTPCTTGGSGNAECTNGITWPVPFVDANYAVTCMGIGRTGFPFVPFSTKTASVVTVTTSNGENAAATASSFNEIDCKGSHP